MAGEQTTPLTTQEAKQRLREAAQEVGIVNWVKQRPLSAVAIGFSAGVLVANSPRTRDLLAQGLSRELLKSLL